MAKVGAPDKYNKAEIVPVICGCIAQGKPLTQILKTEGMPCYNTFIQWITDDDELMKQYACARDSSADFLADEIVYIADTEPDPQVARVRIDARKWVASKLKPKRYGDKVTQEVIGDPEKPVEILIRPQISREEWLKIHGMDTTTSDTTSRT